MAEPRPLFIALHVPKCAGRTLENHFRANLEPSRLWMALKRRTALSQVLPPHYTVPDTFDPQRIDVVTGHFIGRSVERLFPGRTLLRSVMLREPLGFHLSYFNYRSMRYLSQGLQTYTFEDHVRSQPDDPVSHFLLERWLEIPRPRLLTMTAQRKYDLLNACLSEFWFAGDLSGCNELGARISEQLGISTDVKASNTKEQWQSQVTWTMLTREQLSKAQLDLVRERTRLDQALWETWKNARFNVASAVPAALAADAGAGVAFHEAQRPYYALMRRLKRGWN